MLIPALLAFLFAPLPTGAQTGPAIGPSGAFGDWVVACDNLKTCEMTSLIGEDIDWPEDGPHDASIARAAGPDGEFTVTVDAGEAKGSVALRIDDTIVARTTVTNATASFAGDAAMRIVAAAANGSMLTLEDAGGEKVTTVSLAGSSAALRFIDDRQGRAGTATAAIAKGAKPASSIAAAPATPRIPARRASGKAAAIDAAMRGRMEKMAGCEDYASEPVQHDIETVALGNGATLALLPCGNGAYNTTSVPFIVRGATAAIADLDYSSDSSGEAPVLVNAWWDAKANLLGSHAKGRGIGDCGESASYVWDGQRFRLTELRSMGVCRGSINWLRTWVAEPVFR